MAARLLLRFIEKNWVLRHCTQVEGTIQGFDTFLNLVVEKGIEVVKREDQVQTFSQTGHCAVKSIWILAGA